MRWSTSSMPPSIRGCALPELPNQTMNKATGANTLLEVRGLSVSFRTERGLVRAVDNVSFRIGEREIVGVVGESGSGKTVSLMSVMGLINDPNAVIEGSVVYKGRELRGLSKRALRDIRGREIAMIFQDPM